MNGIDDLKRTLEQHGAGLSDHDLGDRAGAVHDRVRVVRRRRRATGAAGVAAALAVVGGVALLPDGDRSSTPPPASRVVGLTPPSTLESLGYTYALADTVDGEGGRVEVSLPASDESRLVTWATDGADDRVTVTNGSMRQNFAVADFRDFVFVPEGDSADIVIQARSGEPGLGVYELTDDRPEGVTSDGVTFRQSVAGARLLGATVGDVGDADIAVEDLTAGDTGLAIQYFCTGAPRNAYVHLSTGGDGDLIVGACDGRVPVDAASGGASSFDSKEGEDASIRLYVTDGVNGPVIDDPDVRAGVGVYALTESYGAPLAQETEANGHRWTLDRVVTGTAGIEATVPAGSSPTLISWHSSGKSVTVSPTVDGKSAVTVLGTEDSGTSEFVNGGEIVGFRVVGGALTPGDEFSIGIYRRID